MFYAKTINLPAPISNHDHLLMFTNKWVWSRRRQRRYKREQSSTTQCRAVNSFELKRVSFFFFTCFQLICHPRHLSSFPSCLVRVYLFQMRRVPALFCTASRLNIYCFPLAVARVPCRLRCEVRRPTNSSVSKFMIWGLGAVAYHPRSEDVRRLGVFGYDTTLRWHAGHGRLAKSKERSWKFTVGGRGVAKVAAFVAPCLLRSKELQIRSFSLALYCVAAFVHSLIGFCCVCVWMKIAHSNFRGGSSAFREVSSILAYIYGYFLIYICVSA